MESCPVPDTNSKLPGTEADLNKCTEDGSVDYKGQPAKRTKTGTWKAVPYLFAMTCVDTMAHFGIVLNLQMYLITKLSLSYPKASQASNNIMGTSQLCPLLGGFLADAYLGRFRGILVFGFVQMLGSGLLTIVADDKKLNSRSGSTGQLVANVIALCTAAVGSGGMRPCISAFGADQYDETDPKERRMMSTFFSWSFFFGVSGVLVSITLLVWVQDDKGFALGYLLATLLLMFGLVAVLLGYPSYRFQKPRGSPLTRLAQVVVASLRKRKLSDGELHEIANLPIKAGHRLETLPHTQDLQWLDRAAMISPACNMGDEKAGSKASIPSAWYLCTVTQVEETKSIVRMIPIMLTTILLNTCAAQFPTWTILQGLTMHRQLGSFVVPPPSIGAISVLTMMLAIPLYQRFFVPFARRYRGNSKGVSPLRRTGAGLALATLSMLIGGLVERERLRTARLHHLQDVDPRDHKNALPMSILWLVPMQITFLAGEFLATVGLTEFFYSQAAERMRTLAVGFSASTTGMGFYLSSALISTVNSWTEHRNGGRWLADNINHGHLDYFYFLLCGLSFLNFLLFLCASSSYPSALVVGHKDTGNLDDTPKTAHLVEIFPSEKVEAQPVSTSQPVETSVQLQVTTVQTCSPACASISSANFTSPTVSSVAAADSSTVRSHGHGKRVSWDLSSSRSKDGVPSKPSPGSLRSPSRRTSSILRPRLQEVFNSGDIKFSDSPMSASMEKLEPSSKQGELTAPASPPGSRTSASHMNGVLFRGPTSAGKPAEDELDSSEQTFYPAVTRFKAPDVWSSDDEGVSLTDFSFISDHFKRSSGYKVDSTMEQSFSLNGKPI